jgi:hypothetical protein
LSPPARKDITGNEQPVKLVWTVQALVSIAAEATDILAAMRSHYPVQNRWCASPHGSCDAGTHRTRPGERSGAQTPAGAFSLMHSLVLNHRGSCGIIALWCCNRHHKSALTVSSAWLTLSGRCHLYAPCSHWWRACTRVLVPLDNQRVVASSAQTWRIEHVSPLDQTLNVELRQT